MIPNIGQLLDDRYEILELIGSGGMAVVYKAMCHRLNRLVAIKILKDEYSGDNEFRRRFQQEGQAVAMLSHPNIVQVYDVSASDDANYIVMELIDGVSLKQYMDAKGVLNWKETLHFSTQIARGLEHAHGRGIVHRDIKPHNIMVLKNGSVKVMDFGIAQVMNKRSTLTKEALGSVHYISPEQAKGSYTDNRSDIYSLGIVMYEMMAGRPPYDGESPVAVAIQHINGGAPAPSAWNPNIPAGLEQIIQRCMALEPRDRFVSATILLHDLEEFRKNPELTFDYHYTSESSTRKLPPISDGAMKGHRDRKPVQGNTGRIPATGKVSDASSRIQRQPRDPDAVARALKRRREEERREAERSRKITIAVVSCSVVAVIAIVVFLVAIFNGVLINREGKLVEVPYVVGSVYSEDYASLYPDLTIRLQAQQYDSFYKQGQIMKQEPAGGSKVSKGTELYLTISMGAEPKVKLMENLVGITMDRAVSFLTGQGLKTLIWEEASDEYAAGYVLRTEPAADQELTDGQTVKLWVSKGPEKQTAKMPDVLDLTKAAALRVLDSLGFRNVSTISVNSDKEAGMVVSQTQTANTIIDISTHIVLEISEGPEVRLERMPDVFALDVDSARKLLNQLGFHNITTYGVDSDRVSGQVVAQSVPADTQIPLTDEIQLGVSNGIGATGYTSAGTIPSQLVTFQVPSRSTSYNLLICHKGQRGSQVASAQIPAGVSQYTVELADTGTREYDLIIDGIYFSTQEVTFTGNG